MWLIAMKGFAGCGKSTLSRALSKHYGWPLVDKDDVKDLLDGQAQAPGPLSYAIMFSIARRQLLQGLSVICDSPLTGIVSYERAQRAAQESDSSLAVLECICSDETLWKQHINDRQSLGLPAHHQTNWDAFAVGLRQSALQEQYTVIHPHLIVDTAQPLHQCLPAVGAWLEHLQQPSDDGIGTVPKAR